MGGVIKVTRLDTGHDCGTIDLYTAPARIGRDPLSTLSFPEEAAVSYFHGEIFSFDDVLFYRDIGSTNGSQINGIYVDKGVAVPIKGGDQLVIANVPLMIKAVKVHERGADENCPKLLVVRHGEPEKVVPLDLGDGVQLAINSNGEVISHTKKVPNKSLLIIEKNENNLWVKPSRKIIGGLTICGYDCKGKSRFENRQWLYLNDFELFVFADCWKEDGSTEKRTDSGHTLRYEGGQRIDSKVISLIPSELSLDSDSDRIVPSYKSSIQTIREITQGLDLPPKTSNTKRKRRHTVQTAVKVHEVKEAPVQAPNDDKESLSGAYKSLEDELATVTPLSEEENTVDTKPQKKKKKQKRSSDSEIKSRNKSGNLIAKFKNAPGRVKKLIAVFFVLVVWYLWISFS